MPTLERRARPADRVAARLAGPLVAVALLAGACSGDPAPGPSTAPPSSPSPAASSTAVPPGGGWDPATWVLPEPITPPTVPLAEAEKDRRRELRERAEKLVRAGGLTKIPTSWPRIRRWITPDEEGEVFAGCLNQRGWDKVEGIGGTLSTPFGEKLPKGFAADQLACLAEYPMDPRIALPWTREMKEANWLYLRDYGVPCMQAHGFERVTPFPTLEQYLTDGADPLDEDDYPGLEELRSGDWKLQARVEKECPNHLPYRTLLGPYPPK